MRFKIIAIHHVSCGPQTGSVSSASIRCYLCVKMPVNDMATFEAFDIPTSNLGPDLLPVGTQFDIKIG